MYLVVGVHSDISEKICPCFILARFNRQHEIHLSLVLVQSGMANDPINLTGFELNFIISLSGDWDCFFTSFETHLSFKMGVRSE